ncbi:hypothetical protein [Tropicimonas aquimaris]|uniref:Uncharacterized protein n=1 Tax=Tropicimonas aquimaris TaxID=914152 RepID=A0ABW3IQC9_9RHOB
MPSLENLTLALLAESIALDQGESKVAGNTWLEERLGREILASAISEGPIEGLIGSASPSLDPSALGRQVSERLVKAFAEDLRSRQDDVPGNGFLGIPPEEVCSSITAFLTIGLGIGPRAACPAGALILRRLNDASPIDKAPSRGAPQHPAEGPLYKAAAGCHD